MITHPHRYYLFADVSGAEWVRGIFAQLGDGGSAESQNCRVPLSPSVDPTSPPVAYACSFAVTEPQRQQLEAIEGAGQIPPGVSFCRVDAAGLDEGVVRYSNHPIGIDRVGLTFDLAYTLDLLGLAFHLEQIV